MISFQWDTKEEAKINFSTPFSFWRLSQVITPRMKYGTNVFVKYEKKKYENSSYLTKKNTIWYDQLFDDFR